MKTQTEINQAQERIVAAEKLISKAVGRSVSLSEADFLTEEEAMGFEEMLDQYEKDLDRYGDIIDEMEAQQKKESVKSTSATKVNSATTTLKQLVITVKSFISAAIAKIIAVKNFVSVVITKTIKAKNLIKAAAIDMITLIKS